MYLATVARETLIPSFRSSLWIRGRPAWPWRIFQVQYERNPLRCQLSTVPDLTIMRTERLPDHTRDSHIHNNRSVGQSATRFYFLGSSSKQSLDDGGR